MKKTLILLSFLILGALPAFAQNNEVGFFVGGAKALKTAASGKSDLQHGFEELHRPLRRHRPLPPERHRYEQ
jgi:hypothetical protein